MRQHVTVRFSPGAFRLILALALGAGLGAGLVATATAQTVTLRGFVTDALDGQPLQGANIVVREATAADPALRGAVTDKDGFYQLGQLPPGRYAVQISFIGYTPHADTLALGSTPFMTLTVALEAAEGVLGEVVVGAEGGAAKVSAGLQTLRPQDLARIPTPDASGDLASYLQALPSVVAIGDRGGQLFIRGGTPAQNLVLLDGFLVYQPFHIVGFFSAFPQDLISHVDLYAGGFGARYSGRVSAVIDVSARAGNKEFFEGAASVSPFLSSVRVEGPLRRGRLSFLTSVRRSAIERVAPTLLGQELPFRFGDLFFKLQQTDQQNNRCSLTVLRTYDQGRINPAARDDAALFRWSNVMAGGRCLAFPSASPYLVDLNTGVSYVKNAVGDAADPERQSNALRLSSDFHLTRLLRRGELSFGLFVRMNWLSYRLAEQFSNLETNDDVFLGLGAYVEPTFVLGERLRATPGLSVTFYPLNYPTSVEPRLRLAFKPGGEDGRQEFSAAAGLYRQVLAGISDERDAGSAFIAWMPAPVRQTQTQAAHLLLGWQHRPWPWLQLGTEGYYKRLTDLPIPIWSTIARFTTTLDLAQGDIYGYDARAEVQHRGFYAYLGYGYATTTYTAQQDHFAVWFGEPIQRYHPPHDRRHQLNAVLSLDVRGVTTSVRWQYGSGLPYTRPFGFDELLPLVPLADPRFNYGTTRVLYRRPYTGRLPAYHRLDLSAERPFALSHGTLTLQLGLINGYNRQNVFYYDLFTVSRVDQLPLIPNLSIKYESR